MSDASSGPDAPKTEGPPPAPRRQQHGIRRFGLTGGLASGKSSVARQLRARGVPVIDADALARDVVAPNTEGLAEIVRHFGPAVLRDGALDRQRLASVVFADARQLKALEDLTHPRIQSLREERLAELERAGEPLVACEVPLLYEKGLDRELELVVVVSVPEQVQVARAMQRDGASEAEVKARLAAQWPLAEKARRADYVIDNAGSLAATCAATDEVLRLICQRLGVDSARYFGPASQEKSGGTGSDTRG